MRNVFIPLCPQSPESILGKFLYTFDHHDKVTPFHRIGLCFLVIGRCLEMTSFQMLNMHCKPSILGMEKTYKPAAVADEYEYIAILHAATNTFPDYSA